MPIRIIILLNLVLTFLLISLGGYVHNTDSSLACPDWPLCYGQVMPVMEGGVLIEHSHRLLGSMVGALTLLLVIILRNQKTRKIAFTALLMVIIQGVLGGLTVIYQLPPLVSTAHLALSMIFFCTLIYLDHKHNSPSSFIRTHPFFSFVLFLLYFQIILGAFIRHFDFGTVCGLGNEYIIKCAQSLSLPTTMHMLHRCLGLICGILITVLLVRRGLKETRFIRVIALLIVLTQIWLGTMVISTAMRPFFTMLHLSGAALLLGILWKLRLLSNRNDKREIGSYA